VPAMPASSSTHRTLIAVGQATLCSSGATRARKRGSTCGGSRETRATTTMTAPASVSTSSTDARETSRWSSASPGAYANIAREIALLSGIRHSSNGARPGGNHHPCLLATFARGRALRAGRRSTAPRGLSFGRAVRSQPRLALRDDCRLELLEQLTGDAGARFAVAARMANKLTLLRRSWPMLYRMRRDHRAQSYRVSRREVSCPITSQRVTVPIEPSRELGGGQERGHDPRVQRGRA
jgi:hypothetical protein